MNSESSVERKPRSRVLVALLLVLVVLSGLLAVRSARQGDRTGDAHMRGPVADPAAYWGAVTPVFESSLELSRDIASNAPDAQVFASAERLSQQWMEVKTAPGYDPGRHDPFIITFSKFFSTLKAGDLVRSAGGRLPVGADRVAGESDTELLFALMALYDAETDSALYARSGRQWDEMVTRSNLIHEVSVSRTRALELLERATELHGQLEPARR